MRGKARLWGMAALAGIALLLSGCAGVFGDDQPDQPNQPAGSPFAYNGVNWVVTDDTGSGTLMLTAPSPQVNGPGTLGGYRLAVSGSAIPDAEFLAAAKGWFAHTGRFCSVTTAPPQDTGDTGWFDRSSGDSDDISDTPAGDARTYSYHCDWLP